MVGGGYEGADDERARDEQQQRRDDQRHEATTAGRVTTATVSGRRAPRLPSATPSSSRAPPAQIQLTSGLIRIRNDAGPSGLEPTRITYTSASGWVVIASWVSACPPSPAEVARVGSHVVAPNRIASTSSV